MVTVNVARGNTVRAFLYPQLRATNYTYRQRGFTPDLGASLWAGIFSVGPAAYPQKK
jgi:hypothetical protein